MISGGIYMVALTLLANPGTATSSAPLSTFAGMCDASAAALIDGGNAMLVADDEQSHLCLYSIAAGGIARQRLPLDIALGLDPTSGKSVELDIEAVAELGNRHYWIASHGRNNQGELRKSRRVVFATKVTRSEQGYTISRIGLPYRKLAEQLTAEPQLSALGIAASLALKDKKNEALAPKVHGFNIEGLTETGDGHTLLIGLRNPQPQGKAILIPWLNPAEVLEQGSHPSFGRPILLDLRVTHRGRLTPLGVRSLAFSPADGSILIAAGPHGGDGPFAVFRWSGSAADEAHVDPDIARHLVGLSDFTLEAIAIQPNEQGILLLSDDGSRQVQVASPTECTKGAFRNGTCNAKDLLDDRRKTFRGLIIRPTAAVVARP